MKFKLDFLQNWIFKAIVITVFPFIIGLIDNVSDWLDANGNVVNIIKNGKIFVVILTVIYIVYVIYIAYTERRQYKNYQNIEELKEQNAQQALLLETYNITFDSMNNLMNVSQKEINDLSKQIISTNNLDLLNWNFESIANYICKDIVGILSKISKSGTDISVNIYVRRKRKTGRKTQDCIKMIAHWGGTNSTPS
ncbi:MAG: hypothetical protein PUC12_12585, partial [Clostridiales bacterium]|nr:hypothetical protein [Clostridiales bacterium]